MTIKILLLAMAILLLSCTASAAWWDAGYTYKKPILLPTQDINMGATIQVKDIDFSAMTVLSSLDDVRIVDENADHAHNELDRLCDGTDSSTDGNCFFRLPYTMPSGDPGEDSTYYMYYGNAAATSPPDENAARTTVQGFEAGEPSFYKTDTGTENVTSRKWGAQGYEVSQSDALKYGIDYLTGGLKDFNYSLWYMNNGVSDVTTYLQDSGGNTACQIQFKGDNDISVWAGGFVVLGTYSDFIWYEIQLRHDVTSNDCSYTVFDAAGAFVGATYGAERDATVPDEFSFSGGADVNAFTYLDNVYYAPATLADGLGGAESGNFAPFMTGNDLNVIWAKQNDHIKVTATGVGDAEANNLTLLCGLAPNPATDSNNFCTDFWNVSPYSDLNCTGLGAAGDGAQTIYCRMYDGVIYSIDQNTDTYTADNTAPTITAYYPFTDTGTTDSTPNFFVQVSDAGVGAGSASFGLFYNGVLDYNSSVTDFNADGFGFETYFYLYNEADQVYMIINSAADTLGNTAYYGVKTAYFELVVNKLGGVNPEDIKDADLANAMLYGLFSIFTGIGGAAAGIFIVIAGLGLLVVVIYFVTGH